MPVTYCEECSTGVLLCSFLHDFAAVQHSVYKGQSEAQPAHNPLISVVQNF